MTGDRCGDCGEIIDVTKRVYHGAGGKPRCPICQVLAECRLEIVRITNLADLLDAAERERGTLN